MTITANLADGRVLNFPDGTDPQVIQSTVKKMLTQQGGQEQQAQPPITQPVVNQQAPPVATPQPQDKMAMLMQKLASGATFTPQQNKALAELLRRGRLKPATENQMSVGALNPDQALEVSGGGSASANAEVLATIGSGAIAEPIAGLAGVAGSVLPGEQNQGKEWVEETRKALTVMPQSEEGKEKLETVGKALEPVGKFMKDIEQGLGDKTFEVTGSPALAALATTVPTLASELLGFAVGKTALKATQGLKRLRAKGQIAHAVGEAVPDIDQLKTTARAIYDEIDNSGAVVKDSAVNELINKIKIDTKKAGLDPRITPKAAAAVEAIEELAGQSAPITELDTLRKVAKNVIGTEPAESALAMRIVNNIDDFLDSAGPTKLDIPDILDAPNIGKKYKIARDLWGRARKSELLEESFTKARLQASGFENGLRVQFRSLLNNKTTRKFFNKGEIAAIEKVIKGGPSENIAKLIGRLGFSEGGATNIIGGALGASGGYAAFGGPGVVIVPLVGQVSRKLAQRMTRKGADFANQVIRAGKNAEKITKAYFKYTPKAERTAMELSELLMKQDIDISKLPTGGIIDEARTLVKQNRELIATSIATEQTASQATSKKENK